MIRKANMNQNLPKMENKQKYNVWLKWMFTTAKAWEDIWKIQSWIFGWFRNIPKFYIFHKHLLETKCVQISLCSRQRILVWKKILRGREPETLGLNHGLEAGGKTSTCLPPGRLIDLIAPNKLCWFQFFGLKTRPQARCRSSITRLA